MDEIYLSITALHNDFDCEMTTLPELVERKNARSHLHKKNYTYNVLRSSSGA